MNAPPQPTTPLTDLARIVGHPHFWTAMAGLAGVAVAVIAFASYLSQINAWPIVWGFAIPTAFATSGLAGHVFILRYYSDKSPPSGMIGFGIGVAILSAVTAVFILTYGCVLYLTELVFMVVKEGGVDPARPISLIPWNLSVQALLCLIGTAFWSTFVSLVIDRRTTAIVRAIAATLDEMEADYRGEQTEP